MFPQRNAPAEQRRALASAAEEFPRLKLRAPGQFRRDCSFAVLFSGRTQEAFDCVSAVMPRFPKNPLLRYNLACYACQLGRLEDARLWLERAFALDEKKELKLMALEDPDLEPLWEALRG